MTLLTTPRIPQERCARKIHLRLDLNLTIERFYSRIISRLRCISLSAVVAVAAATANLCPPRPACRRFAAASTPNAFASRRFAEHPAHSRSIIGGTPARVRSEGDERSGSRRTAMSGGKRVFFPRLTAAATTLKRDLAVPREVNLV